MARARNRATQRETILYRLMENRNKGKNEFIPVFGFMGELYIEELGKWGYVSYECSARLSEMTRRNPGLIERTQIRGRSGARYYGYRLHPMATPEKLVEEDLQTFYRVVKLRQNRGRTVARPIVKPVVETAAAPVEASKGDSEPEPWWMKH